MAAKKPLANYAGTLQELATGDTVSGLAGTLIAYKANGTQDDIYLLDGSGTSVLPVVQGGTGLSAPGTSGNVLTSNGTAWVSSTPSGGSYTAGDGLQLVGSVFSAKIENPTAHPAGWATPLTKSVNGLKLETGYLFLYFFAYLGDGVATSFVLPFSTFGLHNGAVIGAQIIEGSTNQIVHADIVIDYSAATITVTFSEPPTTNQYYIQFLGN